MTTFAQDTFPGSVGTLLSAHTDSLGNAWSKLSGTGNITLNGSGGCGSNDANFAWYKNAGTPASADYTVSAIITNHAAAQMAMLARIVDANNFYFATIDQFSSRFKIMKNVGGSQSTLASSTGTSSTGSTTISFSTSGTTLTASFITAGTTISLGPVTDTAFSLAGTSGILSQAGGTDSVSNFLAQTTATTATTYAFSGANSGSVGVTSANISLSPTGGNWPACTLTLGDSSSGGTLTPTSLVPTAGTSTAQTFTYLPVTGGTINITSSSGGVMTDPGNWAFDSTNLMAQACL